MGFLSLFSFLGLAAIAPLLAYAYLKKPPSQLQTISTSFILGQIEAKPVSRKKVKLPLRFYLELLALVLLALAVGGPYLDSAGEKIAILIDDSFSMQALDRVSGETRLNEAKTLASNVLSSTSFVASINLISTSSGSLSETPLSPTQAQASLRTLNYRDSSDGFNSSLLDLIESGLYDKIYSFSDKSIVIESEDLKGLVSHELVGSRDPNAFIENASLSQDKQTLSLEVGASAPLPVELIVKVELAESGEIIVEKNVTVPNSSTYLEQLTLGDSLSGANNQTLLLSLLSPDGAKLEDSIESDNFRELSSVNVSEFRVAIISPLKRELGLDKITNFYFERLSPEEFETLEEKKKEEFSISLFHHSSSDDLPKLPSLYILPPSPSALFSEVRDSSTSLTISSWQIEHPLLRYLKPQLLKPSAGSYLTPSYWATPVVSAEAGSVAVAGEKLGRRYTAIGFELLPFEGDRTPASSVFFLNLLSWLADSPANLNKNKSSQGQKFFDKSESDTFNLYSQTLSNSDYARAKKESSTLGSKKELWVYLLAIALALLILESILLLRLREG